MGYRDSVGERRPAGAEAVSGSGGAGSEGGGPVRDGAGRGVSSGAGAVRRARSHPLPRAVAITPSAST